MDKIYRPLLEMLVLAVVCGLLRLLYVWFDVLYVLGVLVIVIFSFLRDRDAY
jgi:hypothetical protein